MSLLLAHLSDAHIGPLPKPARRELFGKRLTGYINWRAGRDRIHDMEVLAHLVDDMRAQGPDHIAMTGDVLNLGLPAEFPPAAAWLRSLGNPADVSFVPGNHDAYVRGAMPHLALTFAPWMQGDTASVAAFPYLRMRGGVALIGLSSAVPTAPLLASGRLGRDQCAALAGLLDRLDGACARVILIHHPPHKRGATPGRGLSDARSLERVIARHRVDLVIHGHNHRFSLAYMNSGPRSIPVIGVASASAVPGTPRHRAAYHLYRLTKGTRNWTLQARIRGVHPGTRHVGDLGSIDLGSIDLRAG